MGALRRKEYALAPMTAQKWDVLGSNAYSRRPMRSPLKDSTYTAKIRVSVGSENNGGQHLGSD